MANETQSLPKAPPIDALASQHIVSLCLAAQAYLEAEPAPDLPAGEIAIDLAAQMYERVERCLGPEDRAAVSSLLTELRMTFVRKRG
jgi:hypothetical protein